MQLYLSRFVKVALVLDEKVFMLWSLLGQVNTGLAPDHKPSLYR